MSEKNEAGFKGWATRFVDLYGSRTRLAQEFNFTRTLVLASRRWTAYADELVRARTGHPRARWQTLSALRFSDAPVATLDLANRMALRWPTLIRVLHELEAQGLVRRAADASDKRLRMIAITPEGIDLVERARAILDPARAEILAQFSDEELTITEDVLGRMLTLLIERFRK